MYTPNSCVKPDGTRLRNCRDRNETDEQYREALIREAHAKVTKIKIPLCMLRSKESIGETKCQTCAGDVYPKLFACDKFGKCTLGKKIEKFACCVGCTSVVPPPG